MLMLQKVPCTRDRQNLDLLVYPVPDTVEPGWRGIVILQAVEQKRRHLDLWRHICSRFIGLGRPVDAVIVEHGVQRGRSLRLIVSLSMGRIYDPSAEPLCWKLPASLWVLEEANVIAGLLLLRVLG